MVWAKSLFLTVTDIAQLAQKVNNNAALPVGFDALYFVTKLSSTIDHSFICFGLLGAACAGLELSTPGNRAADGKAVIEGHDFGGYGFKVGALFNVGKQLRIGASY
jgi:long-subunit fatty acid transport protein